MADDGGEVMTDADFEKALDALREQEPNGEVGELLSKLIHTLDSDSIMCHPSYTFVDAQFFDVLGALFCAVLLLVPRLSN